MNEECEKLKRRFHELSEEDNQVFIEYDKVKNIQDKDERTRKKIKLFDKATIIQAEMKSIRDFFKRGGCT